MLCMSLLEDPEPFQRIKESSKNPIILCKSSKEKTSVSVLTTSKNVCHTNKTIAGPQNAAYRAPFYRNH